MNASRIRALNLVYGTRNNQLQRLIKESNFYWLAMFFANS